MSLTVAPRSATATPRPVAGPLFRQVARLKIDGQKRRRLLALLAAYADAGEWSPRMADLCARLELESWKVDLLLDRLVADGLLHVEWAGRGRAGARVGTRGRRNRYRILPKPAKGRRV